jgi:hypothetical protein
MRMEEKEYCRTGELLLVCTVGCSGGKNEQVCLNECV